MIEINNMFLIALWKFSDIDKEVIRNKNYVLPKNIIKVAMITNGNSISKDFILKLEELDWYFLEVESIMASATTKELEDYVQLHIEEIKRTIIENEITNQNLYYQTKNVTKSIKKITNEHYEDFLNK